jgi:hypothetical protein
MRLVGCLIISAVILVLFCLGVMQAVRISPFVQTHPLHIAAVMAAVGLLLFLAGRTTNPEEAREEGTQQGALQFMGRLHYWGPMLIFCGVIVASQRYLPQVLSHPLLKDRVATVSQTFKSSLTKSGLTKLGSKTKAPPIPRLKLQGIFYRRPPSAIMNGQLVYVGDQVGPAKVLSIEQHGVTVELSGEKTLLVMGK